MDSLPPDFSGKTIDLCCHEVLLMPLSNELKKFINLLLKLFIIIILYNTGYRLLELGNKKRNWEFLLQEWDLLWNDQMAGKWYGLQVINRRTCFFFYNAWYKKIYSAPIILNQVRMPSGIGEWTLHEGQCNEKGNVDITVSFEKWGNN